MKNVTVEPYTWDKTAGLPARKGFLVRVENGPGGFYATEEEANDEAEKARHRKPIKKMSWSDFKEVEGIDSSIFNDDEENEE